MSGVNVTGMTGGTARRVFAAHTIHGGAGERYVNQSIKGGRDMVSLAGVEARDINIQHRAASGPARIGNVKTVLYGVRDISLLLRREKFPEEVIKRFKDHGINGRYLIELKDDDVMEELGIISPLLKMKLRKLIKDFTREVREIDIMMF